MAVKTIDVGQFYTRKNEEDGVWYELKIGDTGTGIEVKIKGPSSDEAMAASDEYQKAQEESIAIDDPKEKREFEERAVAKLVSRLICDVRGKDGAELKIEGRDMTVSDIEDMIYNSPLLANDITKFQVRKENFLEKKKNA